MGGGYSKGILLAHGMSGNRYAFAPLCKILAEYGYFCLTIDLPSHFRNQARFTMAELSETITEGILLLKNKVGLKRVAVLGHSMGAVGAIFSNSGYNSEIENSIYQLWDEIARTIESEGELIAAAKENSIHFRETLQKIEKNYLKMKELIFLSLKKGIEENSNVSCYVLLAPPLNCKAAIPGLSILRKLKHAWLKKIFEQFFHKPLVEAGNKEGNPGQYVPEKDPNYIEMQFFKTKEVYEFLDYFLSAKEPVDFLTLIEGIAKFKHKEDKVNFFEYFQKKYILSKPKLFIYGKKDMLLKSFLPWTRKGLEKFYSSCGNATIKSLNFSHIMVEDPNQHVGFTAITDKDVIKEILYFLDKNV